MEGQTAPGPSRTGFVERPESDLLLLAFRLDQAVLADALPAYPIEGGVLLPLGEVCRLLSLGVTADPARGLAEGFLIQEARRFHLDVASRTATIEGKPRTFNPAMAEVHQDDIYVSAALLSEWLPVDLTVDLFGALVMARAREPLPLQIREKREKEIGRTLANLGYGGPEYPRISNPYRLVNGVFLDQTLRLRWTGDRRERVDTQFSTFAAGDFFYTEANLYLFGDARDGVTDWRASAGRRDPAGNLLGPLRAREVTVGEVLYPGLDLIALPFSGPGGILSSFPLQRQTQFDRQTFRGELPPGWEVELYQNDSLINFQQARPDGLYEFKDVALFFGLNIFRLVFYSPLGQRREETHRYNVGASLTRPGQFHYRLVGNDPKNATERASLELDWGLGRNVSLSLAGAGVERPGGRRDYGKLGLRGFWNVLFAHLDVAADRERGWVGRAGLQTRLGPLGLSADHSELRDFESEFFGSGSGPIRRRTNLGVNSVLRFSPRFSLPFTLEAQQDRLRSGERINRIANRFSTFSGGVFLSNRVNWMSMERPGERRQTSGTGSLLVSKFLQQFALRGEVFYDLEPRAEVTSAALTAETRAIQGFLFQAGVNRFFRSAENRYLLNLNKTEGKFGFGLNAEYARPQGASVGLNLFIGLARDSRTGDWYSQGRPMARSGAASALVFFDVNGNGIRDPGELPIEGTSFFVNRASSAARTGPDGVALVRNLTADQDTDLSVSAASLEDPLWSPARPGVRFVPRAGKATQIDFAVIASGEITGTVYLRSGETTRELAGVLLALSDPDGKPVQKVRTAYDGYFGFSQVPPGQYELGIVPEDAARYGLSAPSVQRLEIRPDGTILDGVNLVLDGTQTPPAVASAPMDSSRGTSLSPDPLISPASPQPTPSPVVVAERAPTPGPTPVAVESGGPTDRSREEWVRRAEKDRSRLAEEPQTRFAIQLQVDCEISSLKEVWKQDVPAGSLWVLPIRHRGRECFRVLWGRYSTRDAARRATAKVPSHYRKAAYPLAVVAVQEVVAGRMAGAAAPRPTPTPFPEAGGSATDESRELWVRRAEEYRTRLQEEPQTRFAIQLQVDCEISSLKQVWKQDVPAGSLWVLPIRHRGRECFRVLWGRYATRKAALLAAGQVPIAYRKAAYPPVIVAVRELLAERVGEAAAPRPTPATPPAAGGGLMENSRERWVRRAEKDRSRLAEEPQTRFAIQLQIDCELSSLEEAWKRDVPGGSLWLLPIQYRGRQCFRVLWGRYPNANAARLAAERVPSAYRKRAAYLPAVVAVRALAERVGEPTVTPTPTARGARDSRADTH